MIGSHQVAQGEASQEVEDDELASELPPAAQPLARVWAIAEHRGMQLLPQ